MNSASKRALVWRMLTSLFRHKPPQVGLGAFRYRAFLSYRTADQGPATPLHQKLEQYRVSRDLVGEPDDLGPVPRTIGGVFRGREDRLSAWSGRRDSNPRPQPWQGCALPLSYTRIREG